MTEATIWKHLMGAGLSPAGAAGLMGNLQLSSGLNPAAISKERRADLPYNEASYTSETDSGGYTEFSQDGIGYGLAQWTHPARKQALLNFAKATGKSIGNLEMQLEFLVTELRGSYNSVLRVLISASEVRQASEVVLTQYVRPMEQGAMVRKTTTELAQGFYERFYLREEAKKQEAERRRLEEEREHEAERKKWEEERKAWEQERRAREEERARWDQERKREEERARAEEAERKRREEEERKRREAEEQRRLEQQRRLEEERRRREEEERARREAEELQRQREEEERRRQAEEAERARREAEEAARRAQQAAEHDRALWGMARQVWEGQWGNGQDRRNRLSAAGYNYDEVQARVNLVDQLARQVWQGKWGNGQDRRNRLAAAGYDYDTVQWRVNHM